MLCTFGNDEREAAEDDGGVEKPSSERTSLEVNEPQLAFQLFMDALRAPTLLRDEHDLLATEPTRQRREVELVADTPDRTTTEVEPNLPR
jgi:hypothetical protein